MKWPKLLPDWKNILRKAWSIKLLLVAMALTAWEAYLALTGEPGQNVALTILTGGVTAAAFGARLLAQVNMEKDDAQSK